MFCFLKNTEQYSGRVTHLASLRQVSAASVSTGPMRAASLSGSCGGGNADVTRSAATMVETAAISAAAGTISAGGTSATTVEGAREANVIADRSALGLCISSAYTRAASAASVIGAPIVMFTSGAPLGVPTKVIDFP